MKKMLSRQQVAFKWRVERLHLTTGRLYMWTFTFKETMNIWEYAPVWRNFTQALYRWVDNPDLFGIRVAELHPGGHGLHYHSLLTVWLDSRSVWRLCLRFGMGC